MGNTNSTLLRAQSETEKKIKPAKLGVDGVLM